MKMTDDATHMLLAWINIPWIKAYWMGRRADIPDPEEHMALMSADFFLYYKVQYWKGELNQIEIGILEGIGGWSWGPQNKFESWEEFGFK